MNKVKKNKEVKILEGVEKIKVFLKPFSTNLKKNKKNIELIRIIFGLKPKSKQLEFMIKLIFEKNFLDVKITDKELDFVTKKSSIFLGKTTTNVKKNEKKGAHDNKRINAYLELVSGIVKSDTLDKFELNDKQVKLESKTPVELLGSIQGSLGSMNDRMEYVELLNTVRKERTSKQIIKKKKSNTKTIDRINSASEKSSKQLRRILEMEKKINDKINNIRDLKHSCKTCMQKVSKTYQKNTIKKLEAMKKELVIVKRNMEAINSNFSRLSFQFEGGEYLSFNDAKKYVNTLMIKSKKEWDQKVKNNQFPVNIPKYPHITYSSSKNNNSEWVGWSDWLGIRQMKFRSFEESRKFARKLNIKTKRDWEKLVNSGMLPADIPIHPEKIYEKDWKSFSDFQKIIPLKIAERELKKAHKRTHSQQLRDIEKIEKSNS